MVAATQAATADGGGGVPAVDNADADASPAAAAAALPAAAVAWDRLAAPPPAPPCATHNVVAPDTPTGTATSRPTVVNAAAPRRARAAHAATAGTPPTPARRP